jgi:hypothetical protein
LNVESLGWKAAEMYQAIWNGGLRFKSLFGVGTRDTLQLFRVMWTWSIEFGWWVLAIVGLHSHSLSKSRHATVNLGAIS